MTAEEAVSSPLTEQQKRDFCADLLQTYGIQINLNNELLPVLYLAYRSALISQSVHKQNNDAIQKVISEFKSGTLDKISKLETRQVHFQNSKEAFWYAFGWPGLPLIIITVVLAWSWITYHDQQETAKIKEEKINQFSFLLDHTAIRPKRINDTTTAHIINLYPANNYKKVRAGKHFIYNEACHCIEIPLFFSKGL